MCHFVTRVVFQHTQDWLCQGYGHTQFINTLIQTICIMAVVLEGVWDEKHVYSMGCSCHLV